MIRLGVGAFVGKDLAVHNYSVRCLDGGVERTCNPFKNQGGEWYEASGHVNLTGGAATIVYDQKTAGWDGGGQFNANFSAITWHDHSVWIRKSEAAVDLCCAACRPNIANHSRCRAWTLRYDRTSGETSCSLASSTASESGVSRHPPCKNTHRIVLCIVLCI